MTRQIALLVLLLAIWLCCSFVALATKQPETLTIAAVTTVVLLFGYVLVYH